MKNLKKFLVLILVLLGLLTLAVAVYYPINTTSISLALRVMFFLLLSADAICYFVAAWGILINKKWLFPWTVALLVVNILALIFDDIGAIDLAFGVFNILILILVIYYNRKI